MAQKKKTKETSSADKPGHEEKQAKTNSAVREGQENSSILHDEHDPNKELSATIEKDISSTSQEEFIEDRNTKKEGDKID